MVALGVSSSPGAAHPREDTKYEDGGLKSCLKGTSASRFGGRQLVVCNDVVEAYGDAGQEPWTEVLNHHERRGKRKAENKPPATLPDAWTHALSQTMAWIKAKELSMLDFIDQPCNFAWPALW